MRTYLFLLSFCLSFSLIGQEVEPYAFKPMKENPCTVVKNQGNTGTCWAFSGSSLLESELLRLGKTGADVSEIYTVRCIYRDKAENYVRRQGHAQFSQGGLAHDVFNAVKKYGVCPQEAYPGLQKDALNHSKIEPELMAVCDSLIAYGKSGNLPTDWLQRIDAYLDAQFGAAPKLFAYEGRQYTPESYRNQLGIRPEDYVTITSFTHHPMYSNFILEIPDNFSNGTYYNLPLNEMMRSMNFALQSGYTVSWDADVSNKGFAAKHALAIVPNTDWEKKNDAQKSNTFKVREPEKAITQEMRQELFDAQETQDDHLMHVVGLATETNTSGIFYKVKNSWGEISDMKGYFYASEAYMRLNTIAITLNRNAIPQDLRRRLGLEAGEVKIEDGKSPMKRKPMPMEKSKQEAKEKE